MQKTTFYKIVALLTALNLYFFISLFCGKNNIINYFSYKKTIAQKTKQKNELIKERDRLATISASLEQKNVDLDALEELLRQSLQVSKTNEKVILDS